MHPRCRQQLNAARIAAGENPLTDAQAAAIEARMRANEEGPEIADEEHPAGMLGELVGAPLKRLQAAVDHVPNLSNDAGSVH